MNNSGDEVAEFYRNEDGVTYQVVELTREAENQSMISCSSPENILPDSSLDTANCQYYVIDTSNGFLPTPGTVAAKVTNDNVMRRGTGGIGKKRDERRRATHNEVERRRRDKINHWIMRLANIIPSEQTNSGSESGGNGGPRVPPNELQSKGGILSKACEYITELKETNNSLTECLNDKKDATDQLQEENSRLKIELDTLKKLLFKHGIVTPPK